MLYKMITTARDKWYSSNSCTVKSLVDYMTNKNQIRDAQIEAIKTYLYLKIACNNKPLANLFISGCFNNIDLDSLSVTTAVRDYLSSNPSAAALYEYANLKDDNGQQVSEKLSKLISTAPESIDYHKVWNDMFYGVSYTDYLFSLPMGAGKTYLMAAFIYLDLYFAVNEPQNPAFAHNFIIFAPSGLKSSVVPSLKTIQKFQPDWILPEPAAGDIKRKISFEVLDQSKTANNSNKTKNPNVQKIANHQPLAELFGLVAVTNAEKVIYDKLEKENIQIPIFESLKKEEQAQIRHSKELRNIIGRIPQLSIYIDEVHHAASGGDSKLRMVVTKWTESNAVNSVIGFSGTPYLETAKRFAVTEELTIATAEITNVVYFYPLKEGVGNFLKRPTVKISDTTDSSRIIESGVREFLNTYKDTVYDGGLVAKLGIYCCTITKLEELVFPLVSAILAEYGLSSDLILKFHKGNDKYPQPTDSQMQFDILDSSISRIRIVLLVQIGKEGWDCRSLTGIVLSQEGDCDKTMVLQTSCRCLRQVTKNAYETALIYLNASNADTLNIQLQKQQHISLKEFSEADNRKTVLHRYNRTDYLHLPKVEYYQLKINYQTVIVEDKKDIAAAIATSTDKADILSIVKTTDLTMKTVSTDVDDEERGHFFASFTPWLCGIAKESFGFITVEQLKKFEIELKSVFNKITYISGSDTYFSSKFNRREVEANIRKAFYQKRDFITTEELIPDDASLLNISNFTSEVLTDKPENYYPEQTTVENIILDDNGELKIKPAIAETIKLLEEDGDFITAETLKKKNSSHPHKNRSFHYLPYRTDSSFEQTFLKDVLTLKEVETLDLEVYYNGDRDMTEFKIKCYKHSGAKWQYIGMYTPDFLIIKRKDGKIHKAIIVETKGAIYASDPIFKDKRDFMEAQFTKQNNYKFGYDRFDYLYLEDALPVSDRIKLTHRKICEFFEEII